MCSARRRGPRTHSRTTDASLDCRYLVFVVPKIRIPLLTWFVTHSATDPTGELLHLLAMSFSMGCLWFRHKWCAWAATYCSSIAFACTTNDDVKQLMSSFMLSLSSMYMSYSQNPGPMVLGGGRWSWDPWNPFW